jgi:redox-sensitive bicupin YhaK (pirin superfamily)
MRVYDAIKAELDGFDVMQAFPNNDIRFLNPFILLHHGHTYYNGGGNQKDFGVPPHPHRGFVPVTIILKGSLHHRDSLGNSSVISAGGVQWTSSGKGLIHSERPSIELVKNGGELELIQLWLNLPAKDKMIEPEYFAWESDEIPKIIDDKFIISIICGNYKNIKGVASSRYELDLLLIEINKNNFTKISLDSSKDTYIYIISGNLTINDTQLSKNKLIVMGKINELDIKVNEDTQLLVMSGNDNGENVAAVGPFVMNTIGDAKRSFIDYANGDFGVLREEF